MRKGGCGGEGEGTNCTASNSLSICIFTSLVTPLHKKIFLFEKYAINQNFQQSHFFHYTDIAYSIHLLLIHMLLIRLHYASTLFQTFFFTHTRNLRDTFTSSNIAYHTPPFLDRDGIFRPISKNQVYGLAPQSTLYFYEHRHNLFQIESAINSCRLAAPRLQTYWY